MKFFPGSTNTENVVLCHFRETLKLFGKVGSAAFEDVREPANVDQATREQVRINLRAFNLVAHFCFKIMNPM
jgi:hypothetical protein